jgi:uncharacterized membrane protein YfbV (UPF0208 family)
MVTFPELLASVGIGATIFGVIVAIGAWINGKRTINILGSKMDKGFSDIGTKLDDMGSTLREILNELRMQSSTNRR